MTLMLPPGSDNLYVPVSWRASRGTATPGATRAIIVQLAAATNGLARRAAAARNAAQRQWPQNTPSWAKSNMYSGTRLKAGLPPRTPRRMGCRPRCFNPSLPTRHAAGSSLHQRGETPRPELARSRRARFVPDEVVHRRSSRLLPGNHSTPPRRRAAS
jgi:hypothetical protein